MLKNIIIVLLLTITIFSVSKYIVSLKEKSELLNSLERIKAEAMVLEIEKQKLLQALEKKQEWQKKVIEENSGLKDSLRANKEKLAALNTDFAQAKEALEQLNSKIIALKEEKDKLNLQLTQVSEERDNLKSRLSSIAELKKAIKELKRQMHKVSTEIKERVKTKKNLKGNRGFLVVDGKSTYPAKVKIEVELIPKN